MQRVTSSPVTGLVLALFRAYMGFFWISHGWGKVVNPQWAAPGGVMESLIRESMSKSTGAYHDFIASTVLPNAPIFAHLVAYGETLAGVSLLIGLFSQFGALVGVFLALNYWFLSGGPLYAAQFGTLEFIVAVACAVHVLIPTGRAFGIDALLGRRTRVVREPMAAQVPPPPPPREPPIARPVQYPPPPPQRNAQ